MKEIRKQLIIILKQVFYILFLFISLVACEKDNHKKTINLDLQHSRSEKLVDINFKLTGSDLIADFEKQLDQDLCENQNFSARLKKSNSEIIFPVFASKNCNWPENYSNIINILINQNSVLFPEALLSTKKNISNDILEIIKNNIEVNNNQSLDFIIQWKKETKDSIVEERVLEVLSSIEDYYNLISIKKFQKEISDLNDSEKEILVKEFKFRIGFQDSENSIPAPNND